MRTTKILEAKAEAERFLARVAEWQASPWSASQTIVYGSKKSGAIRRASMDLTRALTEMRKS